MKRWYPVLFFLFTLVDSFPQDEKKGVKLAIPKDLSVVVVRGESVEITLEAEANILKPLEFIIRTEPASGSLGRVRPVYGKNLQAKIRYTADAQGRDMEDGFTYAVRIPGGNVSISAKVSIRIREPKAELTMPSLLDFGRVLISEKKALEVEIANVGTKDFEKKVELPLPWRLLSPTSGVLSIPKGEQRKIKIEYAPKESGTSEYRLDLQQGRNSKIKLLGNATAFFSILEETVELAWEEKSKRREGYITVSNHLSRELEVRVKKEKRLHSASTVLLEPNEDKKIKIHLEPHDQDAYTGTIEIVAGQHRQSVEISAGGSPAHLVVLDGITDIVPFGSVLLNKGKRRVLQIKNTGNTKALLDYHTTAPFRVESDRQGLSILPNETLPLEIYFNANALGKKEGKLTLSYDDKEITLRLIGNVVQEKRENRSEKKTPDAQKTLPLQKGESSTAGPESVAQDSESVDTDSLEFVRKSVFEGLPLENREYHEDVPRPGGVKVKILKGDALKASWSIPQGDNYQFVIEQKKPGFLDQEKSRIAYFWYPREDLDINIENDRAFVVIDDIKKNVPYEYRLVTIDSQGRYSRPLGPYKFMVPEGEGSRLWMWGLGGLLLVGGGYLVYKKRFS